MTLPPETKPKARRRPPAKSVATSAGGAKAFRRLKWDELVYLGDFVADGRSGFELWEGPTGFRADSFLKPIYRSCRAGGGVKKLS